MSNYTKILKANTKKQSIPEALFGKEKWEEIICGFIIVAIWITGIVANAVAFNCYGHAIPDNLLCGLVFVLELVFVGTTLSIFEIAIVFLVFLMILGLLETVFVTIPVRLQRRYLPFTEEEMRALPFETEGEFYDFLLHMCSRKLPVFGHVFVNSMQEDIKKLLTSHNQIIGKPEDYIWEGCHEELLNFLKKEIDEEEQHCFS